MNSFCLIISVKTLCPVTVTRKCWGLDIQCISFERDIIQPNSRYLPTHTVIENFIRASQGMVLQKWSRHELE